MSSINSSNSSKVVSLTAILAVACLARGSEINDDTDGQSLDKSSAKYHQSYDAKQSNVRAQGYHQNHGSTRQQRRIANNKQRRRLVNRRHRVQHTNKQKQSHRQAQFASTSQRPQQPNNTSPQSSTQSNTQTTQLAAPKCGPTSGTYHSPYIGCYTDKINDRIMSFELPNKYHSVLTCEKQCSDRKVPRLYLFHLVKFCFVHVGEELLCVE